MLWHLAANLKYNLHRVNEYSFVPVKIYYFIAGSFKTHIVKRTSIFMRYDCRGLLAEFFSGELWGRSLMVFRKLSMFAYSISHSAIQMVKLAVGSMSKPKLLSIAIPVKRLLLFVFLVLAITSCSSPENEKSEVNLETSVVKIEIEGKRFDVPLRYMYGEAIIKYKRWPTPKKERVKVGALNLSMLLPGLKPYYPEDEAKWKELGPGDRIRVSIAKGKRESDWYQALLKQILENGFYYKEKDAYGLMHFPPKGRLSPLYLSVNERVSIYCSRADLVDFPGCSVRSSYLNGIVLDYSYGVKYLSQWKTIDKKIKKLFDSFAVEEMEKREGE